jgi:hypothetical protein
VCYTHRLWNKCAMEGTKGKPYITSRHKSVYLVHAEFILGLHFGLNVDVEQEHSKRLSNHSTLFKLSCCKRRSINNR